MGDRRCSLLILPCLDRGKDVAAVDDPPVFGVYAKENMDSEDEDEDADVDVDPTVGNRRALEMDDDDEGYVSDGRDIED